MFVAWFTTSGIGLIGAAGAAVTFINDTMAGAQILFDVCSGVAGIFGLSHFIKTKIERLAHEKRVYLALTAPYKNEGLTKLQKFEQLTRDIKDQQDNIKTLRSGLRELKPNVPLSFQMSDEHYYANKCDLKFDPYNCYLYEKQKYSPSTWTKIKKAGKRVYQAFAGGESGLFLSRSVFLIGGIGMGAITPLTIATGGTAAGAFAIIAIGASWSMVE